MKTKMWSLLLLVGVTSAFPNILAHKYDGEKVFRVTPHNEEEIEVLSYIANNMQVDFWRPDSIAQVKLETTVDFRVEADRCFEVENLLQQSGMNYEELPERLSLTNFSKVTFLQPEEMQAFDVQLQYPDMSMEPDRVFIMKESKQCILASFTFLIQITMIKDITVLIDNLQAALDAQLDNHVRASGHQYEKYNNWEKIEAWTADIANENPGLVSRLQIGTTFENRAMYLLKIGKPGVNKKAIFMDCGFHAREWISPAFCQWFVREAVRTYGKETIMTGLLDNLDFYVLPVVNIDGYVYTWTTSRMWRKTRSVNAASSCIGTDPNRNFDAGWCTVGASKSPCSDTYCGSAPESEKETKALADFIRNHLSTIRAYLTIHSYSQLLLYPYSYTYDVPKNNVELNTLAKATVKELETLHGTKYSYGPGASTIYPAAGGSDDWAYDQGIKYSFTFELRDTGRYGFALPESKIKPTCEETLIAVKYIASYVLEHLY